MRSRRRRKKAVRPTQRAGMATLWPDDDDDKENASSGNGHEDNENKENRGYVDGDENNNDGGGVVPSDEEDATDVELQTSGAGGIKFKVCTHLKMALPTL